MSGEAEVIARYEALRCKLESLTAEADRVDAELVEIERRLPDDYHYRGDASERR